MEYATAGFRVVPCWSGTKKPILRLVPHWSVDASRDPEIVRSWFNEVPDANVGIVLDGIAEVVDVDEASRAGPFIVCLTDTPWAQTGKSFHFFVARSGLSHRIGLMEKVDLLTKGFVLAPPSRHATRRSYRWIRPPVIGTEGQWVLPPLPEKIRTEFAAAAVQLGVRQQPGVPPTPLPLAAGGAAAPTTGARPIGSQPRYLQASGVTAWGRAVLQSECEKVLNTPEGSRNAILNSAAFRVGQALAAGRVEEREARYALGEARGCRHSRHHPR